jgi:glycosyltransferase involved in cell wall biosynthesis
MSMCLLVGGHQTISPGIDTRAAALERASATGKRVIVTIAVRALTRGGAQTQCVTLAQGLSSRGHTVHVAVFYSGGSLESVLRSGGISVVSLGKQGRWNLISPTKRLLHHLRNSDCQVLYTFLPMENLLGLCAARRARLPIVWSLRAAGVNTAQFGLGSRILYGVQRALLGRPDAVVSNSHAAIEELALAESGRYHVVPNGVDTERFVPSAILRAEFRRALGLGERHKVVGIVARLDPMKDHQTFLAAASLVAQRNSDVRFVVVGDGTSEYRDLLIRKSNELELDGRVIWLREVANPEAIYSGIDLLVLSSMGEGLPNALLEGMACGLPVVATRVGDNERVIGGFGRLVPPAAPAELGAAILATLLDGGFGSVDARRNWIRSQYGIEAMINRTEEILTNVVSARHQQLN